MDDRNEKHFVLPAADLSRLVDSAGLRTLELHGDLTSEQLVVPILEILNPLLWEIGHVAFFYEAFLLRSLGFDRVLMPNGEELYNSFNVDHDERWRLPLPSRDQTSTYARDTRELVTTRLADSTPNARSTYLHLLAVQHEDMHAEAFTYMRQTLGYTAPKLSHVNRIGATADVDNCRGDVEIPGGRFLLGADPDTAFVYDNEKWAHEVQVAPFRIARTAVTTLEYLEFVEDDGYSRRELWSPTGWLWREREGLTQPIYWRRESGGEWHRKDFDRWVPLNDNHPIVNVSWHEVDAFCRWAKRRLPSEAEWEFAAASQRWKGSTNLSFSRGRVPWSQADTNAYRTESSVLSPVNLDWNFGGCIDVDAFPESDSPFGCRQMIGNVWEWTSSAFYPFPGYVVDSPYREYSAPWFGLPKVLKGGSWSTPPRLAYNAFRNFFPPGRNDIFAGFRTCAQ